MDALIINELRVSTRIGVYSWEQAISQKLLIDITIPLDFTDFKDELKCALDYDVLCSTVTQYVESKSFKLIETVANQVADLIQKEFNIKEVSVVVSKPGAVKNAKIVKVMVSRT